MTKFEKLVLRLLLLILAQQRNFRDHNGNLHAFCLSCGAEKGRKHHQDCTYIPLTDEVFAALKEK